MGKNTKTYNTGVFTFCNVPNFVPHRQNKKEKKKAYPYWSYNRKLATILFFIIQWAYNTLLKTFKNDILH